MVERIVEKLQHVEDFAVTQIYFVPSELRVQLVDFAASVIE